MKATWKKTLTILLGGVMLTAALSACGQSGGGGGTTPPDTSAPAAASSSGGGEKTCKVAAVIPGSINDGAWGTMGYNAAKEAAEAFGAEFSYIETNSPADVLEAVEDYSARGFDLIFAHSNDYQDACARVAEQYPDTYYLVTSGNINTENITAMSNRAWEGAYLAGVIAAKTSANHKVAYVGPQELPNIKESMIGFKQGALDTDPSVEVVLTFVGSGTDVGKAKESTLALINNGVDVILVNANKAGEGCYAAGMEHLGEVLMISANSRRFDDFPELMVGAQPNNYAPGVSAVLSDIVNGTFESGSYSMGVADGAIACELSPYLELDPEVSEAYEAAKQGITDGSITVCRTEEELAAR
ncbi:BMP family protein [Pseudoflavonifractor sp. 524-17]|uniref:BMP family protein n=1 Tax=Pseudoflavonifractor sp. 524-17 TaxID=2304577 RepID=UPI00137A90B4|nr:BMP family protein [Pseudoflavonifractor sp. 524-17]